MTTPPDDPRIAQLQSRAAAIQNQTEAIMYELQRAVMTQTPPSLQWWERLQALNIDGAEFTHELYAIAASLSKASS